MSILFQEREKQMSEETVSSEQLSVSSEEEVEKLKEVNERQGESLLSTPPENPTPSKTQGVRLSRDGGAGVLQSAAKKAAASNSRSDIHEYMRLRRSFV